MAGNNVTMGPIPNFAPGDDLIQTLAINGTVGGLQNQTPGTVIPAVPGKRISIHAIFYTQNNTAQVNFLDLSPAGATVAIINAGVNTNMALLGDTPFVLPFCQYPWMTCAVGDAFGISTGAASTIFPAGRIMFVQA